MIKYIEHRNYKHFVDSDESIWIIIFCDLILNFIDSIESVVSMFCFCHLILNFFDSIESVSSFNCHLLLKAIVVFVVLVH
jgi:hypothetical protein